MQIHKISKMIQQHLCIKNAANSFAFSNIGLEAIAQTGKILISSYATQLLFLLSQNKVVGSQSSPNWGVLLPDNNGQIHLISEEFIEVIVPSGTINAEVKLKKQQWKLKELKFLDPEDLLTKLRTDIAVIVLGKILMEKQVDNLVEKSQKTKKLYESISSYQECADKYYELYLHQVETIIKLKNLQFVQMERIGKLLLVLDFVDTEKENVVANFDCYQAMEKEAQQKRQGLVDFVEKFMSLDSTNIS